MNTLSTGGRLWRWALWAWIALVIVGAFFYAPLAKDFIGQSSRILFFHVPMAWSSFVAFITAGVGAPLSVEADLIRTGPLRRRSRSASFLFPRHHHRRQRGASCGAPRTGRGDRPRSGGARLLRRVPRAVRRHRDPEARARLSPPAVLGPSSPFVLLFAAARMCRSRCTPTRSSTRGQGRGGSRMLQRSSARPASPSSSSGCTGCACACCARRPPGASADERTASR